MAQPQQYASAVASPGTLAAAVAAVFGAGARETLRAIDRCDGCGARAYVRAQTATGFELLFCAHHFHVSELALIAQGVAVIDDERSFLSPHKRSYRDLCATARQALRDAFRAECGDIRGQKVVRDDVTAYVAGKLVALGFGPGLAYAGCQLGPGLTGRVLVHAQFTAAGLHPATGEAFAGTAVPPELRADLEPLGATLVIGENSDNRVVVHWAEEIDPAVPAGYARRMARDRYEYEARTFVADLIKDFNAKVQTIWAYYAGDDYADGALAEYVATTAP